MKNPFKFKRKLGDDDLANPSAIIRFMNTFTHTLRQQFGRSSSLFGKSPNGARDYFEIFGYAERLSFSEYYSMFLRGGIAHAVVSKIAKSCWRDVPALEVDDKPVLEDEINSLKQIGFFQSMERADILNRIGNFSVLLIGAPDGLDLNQPLGQAKSLDGYYFNPYAYDGIEITKWDNDPISPRFGKPVEYSLMTRVGNDQNKQVLMSARVVHWTRIVHMAEGTLDNSIEGASALQPVWNTLIDVLKTRGGSSEALYRNGRQKFALEADAGAAIDKSSVGIETLKEDVEAFTNNYQDFMRMQGMTAKVFQPNVASPRDNFDICIEEIAGVTGIPIRVLTGVGGGQLAGTEDRASWNSLVDDRQNSVCSGFLEQALDIFAEAGLFELPEDYTIVWPVTPTLNETEEAKVLLAKSNAFKNVTIGLSSIGGAEVDAKTVFEQIGLEDIEVDDSEIPPDPDEEDDDA